MLSCFKFLNCILRDKSLSAICGTAEITGSGAAGEAVRTDRKSALIFNSLLAAGIPAI